MKVTLILLMCFVAAELVARLWTEWKGNPADKAIGLLEPDAILGWRGRPNLDVSFFGARVVTDSRGFRVVTLEPRQPASLFTYGPSSAFGWGVEARDTYAFLTGSLLGIPPARVRNFSEIGYASSQGVKLIDLYPPREGSLVIFSYGINGLDHFRFLFPTFSGDKEFFASPVPLPAVLAADFGSQFHLLRYLSRAAVSVKSRFTCSLPETLPLRVSTEDYLDNLSLFRKKVAERGARLIVIDTPYEPGIHSPEPGDSERTYADAYAAAKAGDCARSKELFERFLRQETDRIQRDVKERNRGLEQWAAANGVLFVPASKLLAQRSDFVDPIHPSAEGHKKIATYIASHAGPSEEVPAVQR